jgi:hypothetical protein
MDLGDCSATKSRFVANLVRRDAGDLIWPWANPPDPKKIETLLVAYSSALPPSPLNTPLNPRRRTEPLA